MAYEAQNSESLFMKDGFKFNFTDKILTLVQRAADLANYLKNRPAYLIGKQCG